MSALVSAQPIERPAPPESPWLRTLVKLRGNTKTWVGGGLVAIFFGFALFAGLAFWAQMKSFHAGLRPVYVSRGIIPASEDTRTGNP